MSDAIHWQTSTLIDLLRRRARDMPNQTAYTFLLDGEDETQSITFAELDQKAQAIAQSLQPMAEPGERVLLLYPDGLDSIAGLFGCLYAGLVVVSGVPPLAPRSVPRCTNIIEDSGASIVLGPRSFLADYQSLLQEHMDTLLLKWVAADAPPVPAAHSWHRPLLGSESLALLQYTSGSTRTPRGVMLSHRNLLHNVSTQMATFAYDRQADSGVSWLPFSHDMGLIGAILMALYGGGHCVLLSPSHFLQKPVRWLQAISKYKATTSGGPNFAYDLCVRRIHQAQKASLDLSSWTIAFNGAETVRHHTIQAFSQAFRECGFRPEAMYPCYGLAEATLFVTGGIPSTLPKRVTVSQEDLGRHRAIEVTDAGQTIKVAHLVGCGRTLPDQHLAIVHPQDGSPCPAGSIGEIWVSGPSVAQGYYNRNDETQTHFCAYLPSDDRPYLRTGDLGFLLRGELFVTGRLKDAIVIRGTNYYPQDIEAIAEESHIALRPGCSAAFAVESDGEEALVVVCELAAGHDQSSWDAISAIRRGIGEEVGLSTHAVVLVRAGTICKTPNGKIQRGLCKQAWVEGSLNVVQAAPANDDRSPEKAAGEWSHPRGSGPPRYEEIEYWFLAKLSAFGVDLSQVRLDMHLTELNVDSLRLVELKSEIEDVFGIEISAADLFNFPSLATLSEHILELCRQKQPQQGSPSFGNGYHPMWQPATPVGDSSMERAIAGKSRLQRQRRLRGGPPDRS